MRQRAQISACTAAAPGRNRPSSAACAPRLHSITASFAERFRGPEEYVKAGQQILPALFPGLPERARYRLRPRRVSGNDARTPASRRAASISARSRWQSAAHKGLDAEVADLFAYLAALPEGSLDGIFCSQVVEHLPPDRLPEMIHLCASRLARGGVIAIETPNPECLAIFATHFYLDPTHTRPVPHPLLVFYLEEFGLGNIEVRRLSPAKESMPSLASLPADFRDAFFGALDYAIVGKKL